MRAARRLGPILRGPRAHPAAAPHKTGADAARRVALCDRTETRAEFAAPDGQPGIAVRSDEEPACSAARANCDDRSHDRAAPAVHLYDYGEVLRRYAAVAPADSRSSAGWWRWSPETRLRSRQARP